MVELGRCFSDLLLDQTHRKKYPFAINLGTTLFQYFQRRCIAEINSNRCQDPHRGFMNLLNLDDLSATHTIAYWTVPYLCPLLYEFQQIFIHIRRQLGCFIGFQDFFVLFIGRCYVLGGPVRLPGDIIIPVG